MAAPTSHRVASRTPTAIEGLVGVAPHQAEAWRRLVARRPRSRSHQRLGSARRFAHAWPHRRRLAGRVRRRRHHLGAQHQPRRPLARALPLHAWRPSPGAVLPRVRIHGPENRDRRRRPRCARDARPRTRAQLRSAGPTRAKPPGAPSRATASTTPGCRRPRPRRRPSLPRRHPHTPPRGHRAAPLHPFPAAQRCAQRHGRPAHRAPRAKHRRGLARRVLHRLRRARDTQHPRRPRLEAEPTQAAFDQATRFLASVPDATRSAARPRPARSPPGHASTQP